MALRPAFEKAQADKLAAERGWTFKPDGHHMRRVVPSPVPRRIFEHRPIRWLLDVLLAEYEAEFATGSMLPKVEAASGTGVTEPIAESAGCRGNQGRFRLVPGNSPSRHTELHQIRGARPVKRGRHRHVTAG